MAVSKVKWNKTAVAKAAKHPRRKARVEVFQGASTTKVVKRGRSARHVTVPGQWFFRIVAGNGEIIAQSEGYTRRYTATLGAKRVLAAS